MMSEWRFDEDAASFEKALLETVDSGPMVELIKMKCNEIRKDPKANFRIFIGGRFVYIAKTGPVKIGNVNVEPLLVVYTLDEQKKLIQRVFVCTTVSMGEPVMGAMGETLRRAIEHALRTAAHDPSM